MALTGIAVLLLMTAVLLQQPQGAFFRRTPRYMFDGQRFWSEFNRGFKDFEHALNKETEWMDEEITELTSLGKPNREPLYDDSDEDDEDMETSDPSVSFGFPGYLFNFGGVPKKPWWKGPNVCIEREEIDESVQVNETISEAISNDGVSGTFQFSSCQQTNTKYICTTKVGHHGLRKTFVVKYQCCHGHLRVPDKPGCTEVHLNNLMETAEEVGAKDFVQLIRTSNLEQKVTVENLTLFVPSDDAVRDFTDSLQEANQVEFYVPPASARRRRSTEMQGVSMRNIILGHMVSGFHDITDISNEQVKRSQYFLQSEYGNSLLRIKTYPGSFGRMITVNCARVTSHNNYATNGIVNVVDRVIRPVSKTIAELLTQDEQFGIFTSLLKKTGLLEKLQQPGNFTLFAPIDSAFDRLDSAVKSRLLHGDTCVANVLKHHMLSQMLCSTAVEGSVTTINMDGEWLQVELSSDNDKLLVGGVQIVTQDVLGTNGIVHIIDNVIIPDSVRAVTRVLAAHNLTTFSSLIKEAGLSESLDSMSNVTLFAPTNAALAKSEAVKALEELRGDKDKLRDLLLYHITGPEVQFCDFANNRMLKSGFADKSIRLNLYSAVSFFSTSDARATAQCARVLNYNNRACGGVVHVVDQLLIPPSSTILEIIEKGENYTLLRKIIKGTALEESLAAEGPITFLAPTDSTFHKLDEEDLKILLEDKQMANRVLQQHILAEALCCAGVRLSSWPFSDRVRTVTGQAIAIRRDKEGRVHIGGTTVLKCDVLALNGIVHSVNRIMLPYETRQSGLQDFGNPNVEVFLYGL